MPGSAAQLKKLYQQTVGATTPDDASLSTGSIAAMVKYLIANPGGLKKLSGAGLALYPAGPAVGTFVTPAAGSYGSYAQMVASTAAAIYLVGIGVANWNPPNAASSYLQLAVGTGGAGSETSVSEVKFDLFNPAATTGGHGVYYRQFDFPIEVAASTRIAVKGATSSGVLALEVTLTYLLKSNLVAL